MRSAARLTYEGVQRGARRGRCQPIAHLYAAFRALLAARTARGTLDLDLPERRVVLDGDGAVRSVAPRPRLDSHRLIEEFMVLANVAAAEELERRTSRRCTASTPRRPTKSSHRCATSCTGSASRCHPAIRCIRAISTVCCAASPAPPEAPLVNEVMLRSQSQAEYSPDNIGHFGLALPRYAHFTSPIRRYADLLVHRALIRGLRLGDGALAADEAAALPGYRAAHHRRPSAARSSPNATPSTVTWLHTWRTKLARISLREFPV